MNPWLGAAVVLTAAALGPALWLTARGPSVSRLVGLELSGAVMVIDMLVLAQAFGSPSYLIVPFVLVLLSFTGTLVFTRLLGPRP